MNPRSAPLRLLYGGAALLILVLLATNAAVILHFRKAELLGRESELQTLSLTIAEQADRAFQSADLVIARVAKEIEAENIADDASFAQRMSSHDVQLLLRDMISGIPQLAAVAVISRDGEILNSSREASISASNVADRDYIQALKSDPSLTSYLSKPVHSRANGTWTIFLARRIRGANGKYLGVAIAAIELQYFEDFYRAILRSDSGSIAIQRLDGVILARYPGVNNVGRVLSSSQHLLGDGTSGVLREPSPIDGLMRLKAAHRVSHYPVLALATETEEAALAEWRRIAWLMSLGALGCAVSIAMAGLALGRQWQQQIMLTHTQAELRRQEERTAAFEALRIAKEAAEAADRAKSQFLATMSHELRTPLNAVLGFSEVIVDEVFGPLGNERYRSYAKDIHTSGTHLLSIINDILDLSKAASGKFELDRSWFDARDTVDAACRLIRPRVEEARLSLTVTKPPGALMIHADSRLLKQMLLNLLANACKFTPPEGCIELSISVDDSAVTFVVTDTGIGIPAEALERVQQPFVQIDGSLSRRHEGTGLGLALVKVMAELHGGSLRLASEEGRGTTAAIILPLDHADAAGAKTAAESAISWAGKTAVA